ncbi:uncharacterized protein TrAFT101_002779 [Trichoderma asperellum]|uniref:uncharacterized protein n=1 Tax=Trichoderma asperellum TaxID=101201 RepID=UPI0033207551|nr:hypothetical protein TrAFT101_002779 [Trichoderma asperellum]
MLLLFTQVLLVCGAFAFPAAQEAVSCEHDSLYTSLSRDGGDFCSSMVRTPCEVSSTPTQFKSYSSAKLSSYCACLMTSYASYGTAALTATGQSNGTGPYTSWRNSHRPSPTHVATQARSENGGDEGESKTNSDDDSATETGGASASTDVSRTDDGGSIDKTTTTKSSNSLELPTDSAASGSGARSTTQSDMAGSDTGSMTAKVTRTSYDSSQKTSTSNASDNGGAISHDSSATETKASNTTSGSAASFRTVSASTATGDASSTDDSTDSGSGRATSSGERRPFTTASNGQPSNGTLGAQSSSNGSQNSSQRLSIISANFTDTRIPSFTYTVSMPVVTSGNISGTAAWNSSVTYSPWGTRTGDSLSATTAIGLTSRAISRSSSSLGNLGTVTTVTNGTQVATLTIPLLSRPVASTAVPSAILSMQRRQGRLLYLLQISHR